MTTPAEHWSADEAAWLTPAMELDTIELGDRAEWWATALTGARVYRTAEARQRACVRVLVAQVAEAARDRGVPFPAQWLPQDAAGR